METSISSVVCRPTGRTSSSCMAPTRCRSGTQIGALFYGASGTPMSTVVIDGQLEPLLVNGRGDMGRTPVLTRTDLLRLARIWLHGPAQVSPRAERHQPVQPEDRDAHLQFPEQGCTGRRLGDLLGCDRSLERQPGKRLRLQRVDPRVARWRVRLRSSLRPARSLATGLQGQFSVKFIF